MATNLSDSCVIDDSIQCTNGGFSSDSDNLGVDESVILIESGEGDYSSSKDVSNLTHSEEMLNTDEDSSDGRAVHKDLISVYKSSEEKIEFIGPRVSEAVILIKSEVGNAANCIQESEDLHSQVKMKVGDGSSSSSSKSIEEGVGESEIVIRSNEVNAGSVAAENRDLIPSDFKENKAGLRKVSLDDLKVRDLKDGQHSCGIKIKCGGAGGKFGENTDCERICRICLLGSDQPVESGVRNSSNANDVLDIIHLGCGCKDELGIAHSLCAEAWFKLKGNRFCEICGDPAKNITGKGDNRFMEEWNDGRSNGTNLSERSGGCCRRQPFCNFLMACLVIAFVLPWFFRVNMF